MYGCQKVIFFDIEHIVVGRYARCNKFGDAAFDQLFGEFRVFELVANGHAQPGTHKFRQIGVERMMRKSGHSRCVGIFAGTFGQCDAQNFGSNLGILVVCFVKIAATKQYYRVRILIFDVEKLLHHRCQFRRHSVK